MLDTIFYSSATLLVVLFVCLASTCPSAGLQETNYPVAADINIGIGGLYKGTFPPKKNVVEFHDFNAQVLSNVKYDKYNCTFVFWFITTRGI